jgi:hypothetical protein
VNLHSTALFLAHIRSLEAEYKSNGQISGLIVEQLKETPYAAVLLERI